MLEQVDGTERRHLIVAGLCALVVESLFLIFSATLQERHSILNTVHKDEFIEAEIFSPPVHHVAKLERVTPHIQKATEDEPAFHRSGKKTDSAFNPATVTNKISQAPSVPTNHGPIALSTPTPVIPNYLRDREINAVTIVEFLVHPSGSQEARLLRSSGDDELDRIALKTVHEWRFEPAEQDGKPVEAKVRLRVQFKVQ